MWDGGGGYLDESEVEERAGKRKRDKRGENLVGEEERCL